MIFFPTGAGVGLFGKPVASDSGGASAPDSKNVAPTSSSSAPSTAAPSGVGLFGKPLAAPSDSTAKSTGKPKLSIQF